MPGSRRLCTYSARPVTLSHDSSRGTERPTCGVSVACVARFMDRPREIDAQKLLLVVRRAVQVAFDVHLRYRRLRGALYVGVILFQPRLGGGEPRRLVGRGADEDAAVLLEVGAHRDAERGPVVCRARGALEVSGALAAERRHLEDREQLAAAQRRLQVAGGELL